MVAANPPSGGTKNRCNSLEPENLSLLRDIIEHSMYNVRPFFLFLCTLLSFNELIIIFVMCEQSPKNDLYEHVLITFDNAFSSLAHPPIRIV